MSAYLPGLGSRRDKILILGIWLVLLAVAITAIAVLHANGARIIHYIEYDKEGRYARAQILYLESQKDARVLLRRAEQLNLPSQKKMNVSPAAPEAKSAVSAYEQAARMDPRPDFAADRRVDYDFAGQIFEAIGDDLKGSLAQVAAFLCDRNFGDADVLLKETEAIAPANAQLRIMAAKRYELEGTTTRALAIMNDLYSSGSVPIEGRRLMGRLLLNEGQTSKAIAEMKSALKDDPAYLDLRKDLGAALSGVGMFADAAQVFAGGEDTGGEFDPSFLHLYGQALLSGGKTEDAVRVLEKANLVDPNSAGVEFTLATAYTRLGKTVQARRHLARARELDPSLKDKNP
jgi:Flp pilus assembly protein TadD